MISTWLRRVAYTASGIGIAALILSGAGSVAWTLAAGGHTPSLVAGIYVGVVATAVVLLATVELARWRADRRREAAARRREAERPLVPPVGSLLPPVPGCYRPGEGPYRSQGVPDGATVTDPASSYRSRGVLRDLEGGR